MTASSKSQLPSMFEDCLVQALDFALADALRPAIVDYTTPQSRTVSMYSARSASSGGASFPPLEPRRPFPAANVVRLIGYYLDYILSDDRVDRELSPQRGLRPIGTPTVASEPA